MVRRTVAYLTLLLAAALMLTACASSTPSTDVPATGATATGATPPVIPSPSDPNAVPGNVDQVGVIGDSLTAEMIEYDQLEPALLDAGWSPGGIRLDGVWGRPIDGAGSTATSRVIGDWRADGFDPRVWLIALGTNNAGDAVSQWQQDIRGVLNKINAGPAGNYTIYWVTTGYSEPDVHNQGLFLTTMHEIADDYPNVVVADYGAYLDKHRSAADWASMWSDPVHHSEAGYEQLRTPFYLATLEPEAPG